MGTCIYVSRLNAITVSACVLICKIIIHTKKALVVRYELKLLFHKEILDPIRIFLNFPSTFPFSHLC